MCNIYIYIYTYIIIYVYNYICIYNTIYIYIGFLFRRLIISSCFVWSAFLSRNDSLWSGPNNFEGLGSPSRACWDSKVTPKGIKGPKVASERVTKGCLERQSGHDRLRRDDFGAHFGTFLWFLSGLIVHSFYSVQFRDTLDPFSAWKYQNSRF